MTIQNQEQFSRAIDAHTDSAYIAAFQALQHADQLAHDLAAQHGDCSNSEGKVGCLLILAFRAGAAIDIEEQARNSVFSGELREARMQAERRVKEITGRTPLVA